MSRFLLRVMNRILSAFLIAIFLPLVSVQAQEGGAERLEHVVERLAHFHRTAPQEALAFGREGESLLLEFSNPALEHRLYFYKGLAHINVGQIDSARTYAEHLQVLPNPLPQHTADVHYLHGQVLLSSGQLEEAQHALLQAVEHYGRLGDPQQQANATTLLAKSHRELGDYDSALTLYSEALAFFREFGEPTGQGDALQGMGVVHRLVGDFDAALDHYNRALRIREELGDRSGVASSLNSIGIVYRRRGDYDAALDHYQRALRIREEIGDRSGEATTLNSIGLYHMNRGDDETGLSYLSRSLALMEALDDGPGIARALSNMGIIYRRRGDYDTALDHYSRSLRIREEGGQQRGIATTLNNMGIVYESMGDYDAALTAFSRSLEINEAIGNPAGIANVLSNIGDIHRDHGDLDAAQDVLERSLRIREELGDLRSLAIGLHNLGLVLELKGQLDEALSYFTRSIAIKEEIGDVRRAANSLLSIGHIHQKQGNLEEAQRFFDRAMAGYTTVDNAEGVMMVLMSQARAHQEEGQLEEAAQHAARAVAVADSVGALPKLRSAYEQQAAILEAQGNYAKALTAFQAFKAVNDSLYSSESQGVIAELQAEYRAGEQRQRIEMLESNRRQQRLWLVLLLGGLGLLVVIVALMVGRMRLRRRALAAIESARQAEAERAKELRQTNDELHRTAEELQQANESKSRFLANISHEFRTPLTLTFGPLDDLANRRFASIDEALPHIERARRNGGRLLRLINQLLDLSRVDAGALLLHAQPYDLAAHLRNLATLFDSIAQDRRIAFTIHLPEATVLHVYDSDKIEKVVINLLSNAFKFTPPYGKISLALTREPEGMMQIEVADTGPGIAEEHLPHLFDRFYQVESDTRRTYEGTGIGLSLVKELVELHEGTITVESRVGFGTTFTVCLPLLAVPEIEAQEATPVESPPGDGVAASITGSLTIPVDVRPDAPPEEASDAATVVLVVEDNADMRAYIRSHLDDLVTVTEAENGRQGVEQAQADVPDLILSDVMMPEMDGLELCAAVKADERTSHIPVVLLTARAQVEHRIAGFESGADAYLPKPFNAEELRVRVQGLIAERRKLRRRFASPTIAPQEEGAEESTVEVLPPREAAFLAKVQAVVTEHLPDTHFNAERLAEELALSRSQLFRKLGALTEETPAALIRRCRMEQAALLLQQNDLTVKEVSYQVGFRSSTSFSKAFRDTYGVLPSEYTVPE